MHMQGSIRFNKSAFKHNVTASDIFAAFETFIFEDPVEGEENKYLLIGFDTKANSIEVMYNRIDEDRINVFHAMPLRSAYADCLIDRGFFYA